MKLFQRFSSWRRRGGAPISFPRLVLFSILFGFVGYPIKFSTDLLLTGSIEESLAGLLVAFWGFHVIFAVGLIIGVLVAVPTRPVYGRRAIMAAWAAFIPISILVGFLFEWLVPWDVVAVLGDNYLVRATVRSTLVMCRGVVTVVLVLSLLQTSWIKTWLWPD